MSAEEKQWQIAFNVDPEADTKRGQKGSVERPPQESADSAAVWRSPHVVEEAVEEAAAAAAVKRSLTAAAGSGSGVWRM